MSKLILLSLATIFLFGSFYTHEPNCVKCTRVLTFKKGEVKIYDSLEFFKKDNKEFVAAFTFDNKKLNKTVIPYSLLEKIEHSDPTINAQLNNLYK